jgi:long-subunit fatty acid transport protein
LGATLGIQSVNYQRNVFYGENYLYPKGYPSGSEMPYQLEYMNYLQSTRISGAGVNFKVGFTWRPVAWLRIGAAYHTRTAYNLSLEYYADMWSSTFSAGNNPDGYDLDRNGYTSDYVQSPEWEDSGEYAWRVSGPSRLMVGAAVTIAQRLILSADYEAAYYNDMWLRGSPIDDLDYTSTIHEYFRHSNTIRLGAEFRALPFLDLRAGYIYTGDAINDASLLYTHPLIKEQSFITAGLGVRFNATTYLDFAYQYGQTKYTDEQSFFATGYGLNIETEPVSTSLNNHIAVLTLGFRF